MMPAGDLIRAGPWAIMAKGYLQYFYLFICREIFSFEANLTPCLTCGDSRT